jgi:hypothetical protein
MPQDIRYRVDFVESSHYLELIQQISLLTLIPLNEKIDMSLRTLLHLSVMALAFSVLPQDN